MVTVLEAAKRLGRDPETVRRWIRSGRLPARKIGLQYFVDEDDIDSAGPEDEMLPIPEGMRRTSTGEPYINPVRAVRLMREAR